MRQRIRSIRILRVLWIAVILSLATANPVLAGEALLTNGTSVKGDLINEVILISTGTDVVEVLPEQVASLKDGEIRLKDGRIIKGQIVGEALKLRTSIGEVSIRLKELTIYQDRPVESALASSKAPDGTAAATSPIPVRELPVPHPMGTSPPPKTETQGAAVPPRGAVPSGPVAPSGEARSTARLPEEMTKAPAKTAFVVVSREADVHVNAFFLSPVVAVVKKGDRLTYAGDRLRGWIKVRTSDGTIGWVDHYFVEEATP